LTLATEQVVQRVQRPVPLYLAAALMYFVVKLIVSSGGRRLETAFLILRQMSATKRGSPR